MTINSIDDARIIPIVGPWHTKSKADLDVLLALDYSELSRFLSYDETELVKIPFDIRGLRIYRVSNLKKDALGGNEWHKLKTEIVYMTKGSARWLLEDKNGNKIEYTIDRQTGGLYIPTHILHTYIALENDSEIIVLTNTLYNPSDITTHDVYSLDEFHHTE